MIRAIAIDDEPLALDVLQEHAAKLDIVTLERVFTNAAEGLSYIDEHQPDALFLDIRMPDRSGKDIAGSLGNSLPVVFTTAYPDYAITGFELNVTDYLLKPVPFARFVQACNKIKARLEHRDEPEELFVKESGIWVKILLAELLFVEAKGNYLHFETKSGTHLIRQTLQECLDGLPSWFARVHKSYIVSTRAIERIESAQVLVNGQVIPVSSSYKQELFTTLGLKTNVSGAG